VAHPFRFAVQLSRAPTGRAWRDLVRKVEDLGYATVFLPDHLDDQWAPLPALAAAAQCTERLRLGTLVLANDYRHPVVLAKEAATVDVVSDGRLELGLGAGWMASDYEQSGIVLDPPAVRVERLRETVEILEQLWSTGRCDYRGRHYTVRGATRHPDPVQHPRPPLLIGGGSPRVLQLAARHADIVGVNTRLTAGVIGPEAIASAVPEEFDRRVGWIREAAGERFDEIELQCLTFVVQVVSDGQRVVERLAASFGMTPQDARETPVALVGTPSEIAEAIQHRRQRWGFSYWVVHEGDIEAFAPVVAMLAGT